MSNRPEPEPSVKQTPVGALVAWCCVGLLGGWAIRPLSQRYADSSPTVSWTQVLALAFVAAFLLAAAWITRRTIAERQWLDPHRAVSRLVLAKACALVGALVAGGYAGHAIAWIGQSAHLADQRMVRSLLASVAALAMVGAALLLERACRIDDDGEPRAEGSDPGT